MRYPQPQLTSDRQFRSLLGRWWRRGSGARRLGALARDNARDELVDQPRGRCHAPAAASAGGLSTATGPGARPLSHFRVRVDRAGFTLPELLVAVAVIGLIMAGLLGLLMGGQQSFGASSNMVEAQQSARIAITRMMQEIRGAGYNPSGDPALFPAITAQGTTGFTIQNDWNGNGVIENNVTTTIGNVGRGEQVTYFIVGNTLRRRESNIDPSPCNAANDLTCVLTPVEQITLQYLDATNAVTAVAANIRTIVATIQVRPQTQPGTPLQGKVLVSMTDRARIRNR